MVIPPGRPASITRAATLHNVALLGASKTLVLEIRFFVFTKGTDPHAFMKLVADRIRFGSITYVLVRAGAERMYSSKEEVRQYLQALPKTWEMLRVDMRE
jgi:hypothetical protein